MITGAANAKIAPSLRPVPHTTVSFGAPSEKLSLPILGREFFFAGSGSEAHELHRKDTTATPLSLCGEILHTGA